LPALKYIFFLVVSQIISKRKLLAGRDKKSERTAGKLQRGADDAKAGAPRRVQLPHFRSARNRPSDSQRDGKAPRLRRDPNLQPMAFGHRGWAAMRDSGLRPVAFGHRGWAAPRDSGLRPVAFGHRGWAAPRDSGLRPVAFGHRAAAIPGYGAGNGRGDYFFGSAPSCTSTSCAALNASRPAGMPQ
jgi:hypothetical protein